MESYAAPSNVESESMAQDFVDCGWPLPCDRRAAVLCVADDHFLEEVLDNYIKITTHRNKTNNFKFKDSEQIIFKKQGTMYQDLVDKPMPFKIVECHRYNEINGAMVIATQKINKGTYIYPLSGQLYPVTQNFIKPGINDFSIVTSYVNRRDYMFLGPISFINHDCNPNVEWHSRSKTETCVKVISNVHKGQELNAFYGHHYFGINNSECLCQTCELKERGSFSKKTSSTNHGQRKQDTNDDDDDDDDDDDVNDVDDDDDDADDNDDNSDANKPYKCDICKKKFKFRSWFNYHKTTHDVIGQFRCQYCPKLFKRKYYLKRHFITHFGGKNFDCEECGQSFSLKFNLKHHIDTQHNANAKKVICRKCGTYLSDSRQLKYHDNRIHTGKMPYICHCKIAFHAPNDLYRHKKKSHNA